MVKSAALFILLALAHLGAKAAPPAFDPHCEGALMPTDALRARFEGKIRAENQAVFFENAGKAVPLSVDLAFSSRTRGNALSEDFMRGFREMARQEAWSLGKPDASTLPGMILLRVTGQPKSLLKAVWNADRAEIVPDVKTISKELLPRVLFFGDAHMLEVELILFEKTTDAELNQLRRELRSKQIEVLSTQFDPKSPDGAQLLIRGMRSNLKGFLIGRHGEAPAFSTGLARLPSTPLGNAVDPAVAGFYAEFGGNEHFIKAEVGEGGALEVVSAYAYRTEFEKNFESSDYAGRSVEIVSQSLHDATQRRSAELNQRYRQEDIQKLPDRRRLSETQADYDPTVYQYGGRDVPKAVLNFADKPPVRPEESPLWQYLLSFEQALAKFQSGEDLPFDIPEAEKIELQNLNGEDVFFAMIREVSASDFPEFHAELMRIENHGVTSEALAGIARDMSFADQVGVINSLRNQLMEALGHSEVRHQEDAVQSLLLGFGLRFSQQDVIIELGRKLYFAIEDSLPILRQKLPQEVSEFYFGIGIPHIQSPPLSSDHSPLHFVYEDLKANLPKLQQSLRQNLEGYLDQAQIDEAVREASRIDPAKVLYSWIVEFDRRLKSRHPDYTGEGLPDTLGSALENLPEGFDQKIEALALRLSVADQTSIWMYLKFEADFALRPEKGKKSDGIAESLKLFGNPEWSAATQEYLLRLIQDVDRPLANWLNETYPPEVVEYFEKVDPMAVAESESQPASEHPWEHSESEWKPDEVADETLQEIYRKAEPKDEPAAYKAPSSLDQAPRHFSESPAYLFFTTLQSRFKRFEESTEDPVLFPSAQVAVYSWFKNYFPKDAPEREFLKKPKLSGAAKMIEKFGVELTSRDQYKAIWELKLLLKEFTYTSYLERLSELPADEAAMAEAQMNHLLSMLGARDGLGQNQAYEFLLELEQGIGEARQRFMEKIPGSYQEFLDSGDAKP